MLAPILEIVPPTFNVPPIPAPPTTVKAPVVVEPEPVVLVTANPDIDTLPEFGFTTNDVIVDKPNPELLDVLTAVMKCDSETVVGETATEDAAEGGTDCQVGRAAAPLEVKTCPLVLLAANLPQVVVVVA